MKNKGYTLLELLGVIVILSVLVTLVFPSVINFIKKGNDTKESITNELIISAAEDYINDNSSELYLTSGTEYCISVDTLIGKEYLTEITDTNELHSKSVKVTYNNKSNYEIIDSNDCSVCKLVSGTDISFGIKYQCKVKEEMEQGFEEGYYFYLLSTNEDGTINLIMERNIYYDEINDVGRVATSTKTGSIGWYDVEDNSAYGPVTAMDYLYNATKDWDNVPNIIINYNDEGKNYGSIKSEGYTTIITKNDGTVTATYKNLKSRLPKKNEINKYNSADKSYAYLYDYLTLYNNIQQNPIDSIGCYWTLSSMSDSTAWPIRYSSGSLDDKTSDKNGIRPVITVKNVINLN